jgi:hypothetical protein
VTGYERNDRASIPGGSRDFSLLDVQTGSGINLVLYPLSFGCSFRALRRPDPESAIHFLVVRRTKVKNPSLCAHSPACLHGVVFKHRGKVTFPPVLIVHFITFSFFSLQVRFCYRFREH